MNKNRFCHSSAIQRHGEEHESWFVGIKSPSKPFLAVSGLLMLAGILFLYSASCYRSGISVFVKQFVIMIFSLIVSWLFVIRVNLDKLRKNLFPIFITAVVLLIAALILPAGRDNTHRWIALGIFSFQPSDLAKIVLVLFFAQILNKDTFNDFKNSVFYTVRRILPAGLLIFLVLLGKDFGTPLLMSAAAVFMLYMGGVPRKHLLKLTLLFCIFFSAVLGYSYHTGGYRWERLSSTVRYYLQTNPTVYRKDPKTGKEIIDNNYKDYIREGKGQQQWKATIAIGNGGLMGKGPGNSSINRIGQLSESYTDFIFSVMCEELGFILIMFVIILYLAYVYLAFKIAWNTTDRFKQLLASGCAFMIFMQAMIHMAVNLSLLPCKGITLPFFSQGGSSILSTLIMTALIANVSCKITKKKAH